MKKIIIVADYDEKETTINEIFEVLKKMVSRQS